MSVMLSRRGMLQVSALAGGGLLLGFPLGAASGFAPNAFIKLAPDGGVTFVMPNQEMGQGIHTAHSQLLAEEFDVAWNRISLEQSPPDDVLFGGPRKRQGTGGSSSIRGGFVPVLRQAGADARALVVAAAAKGWGVDPASLRTKDGVVFHDASGRKADYGSLAAVAATLPAPTAPAPLKNSADFRLIGTSAPRLDTPAKLNGSATYGIDVRIPGAGVATVAQAPVGGKVGKVDDAAALKVAGVRQVVVLDDLVAVVGDHMWAAKQGLEALAIEWDAGPHGGLDSAAIWEKLRSDSARPGVVAHSKGDAAAALAAAGAAGTRIEADYEMPFLSHAPMEPMNCTVHVEADACTVWTGTQVQTRARSAAAAVLGWPVEKVTVNNFMLGGAFGRRLDIDMVTNAVRIAQKVKGPVKVVWLREADMQNDMYRPAYRNVLAATLDGGKVAGWSHRIAAGSVSARMSGQPPKDGLDRGNVEGATELLYAIPHQAVNYVRSEPLAVNVGYWRGVGPNNSLYAVECFIDELANKAGADPVAFRLGMMADEPRAVAVLKLAAEKAGWDAPHPDRHGRGVAVIKAFGSYLATVAEVAVDGDGGVAVKRLVTAVDAGLVINPDTLVAQIEGGLIYGLTAVLHGDITVDKGRVVESNFHDYVPLRIDATPAMEVFIIKSDAAPGGIGEPGTTSVAPAVVNAIADAVGVRLRRLPVDAKALAKV